MTEWQNFMAAEQTITTGSNPPETRPNRLRAWEYLRDGGWKIGRSSFYNDVRNGLIRPDASGAFAHGKLDKYATLHLRRTDGSSRTADAMDGLQCDKLQAETRRAQALAERTEMELAVMRREYVRRADVEPDYVGRLVVIEHELRQMYRARAGELIALVGGDTSRRADLTLALETALDDTFRRLASVDGFEVLVEGGP
jgi:hypothetical protein